MSNPASWLFGGEMYVGTGPIPFRRECFMPVARSDRGGRGGRDSGERGEGGQQARRELCEERKGKDSDSLMVPSSFFLISS